MRVTAIALLAFSITMVARAKDAIGDNYDLSRVMTVVALDWLSVEGYDVAEPLKAKFTEKKVVSKLCKAIATPAAEIMYHFSGGLIFVGSPS